MRFQSIVDFLQRLRDGLYKLVLTVFKDCVYYKIILITSI